MAELQNSGLDFGYQRTCLSPLGKTVAKAMSAENRLALWPAGGEMAMTVPQHVTGAAAFTRMPRHTEMRWPRVNQMGVNEVLLDTVAKR